MQEVGVRDFDVWFWVGLYAPRGLPPELTRRVNEEINKAMKTPEMLAQYGNIDLTFVPYGGIAQATPDVIAGRVDLAVGAVPSLLPQVKAGALKALAITSNERSALAPAIPTSSPWTFARAP